MMKRILLFALYVCLLSLTVKAFSPANPIAGVSALDTRDKRVDLRTDSQFSPHQPQKPATQLFSSNYDSELCPHGRIEMVKIKQGAMDKEYRQLFESNGLNVPQVNGFIPNRLEHFASVLDEMNFIGSTMDDSQFRSYVFGDNGDGTLETIQRLSRNLNVGKTRSSVDDKMKPGQKASESTKPPAAAAAAEEDSHDDGHEDGEKVIVRIEGKQYKTTEEVHLLNIALAFYMLGFREDPEQIRPLRSKEDIREFNFFFREILLDMERKERLMNIAEKITTTCDDVTAAEHPFEDVLDLEAWSKGGSVMNLETFIVFALENFPPNFVQQGGTCYIAAASMLLTHLLKIAYPSEAWKVFDFHSVILQAFNEESLMERLRKDKGGRSSNIFRSIVDDCLFNFVYKETKTVSGEDIHSALKTYGPALIEGAYITDDIDAMSDSGQRSFPGEIYFLDHEKSGRRHSMLIVGARQDHNKKWWFLLQNWWANAHYFEVDLPRLKSMMRCPLGYDPYFPITFVNGEVNLKSHSTEACHKNAFDYAEDGGFDVDFPFF